MSAFTDRVARRRAHAIAEAQAKEEADLDARMAADPHSEPPSSQRSPSVDSADAPCPGWILRAARGDSWPGDPGVDQEGRAIEPVRPWPADVLPLIERIIGGEFKADDLPPAPFQLQPWVTITDAGAWLEGIRREVSLGPGGARACLGTLQGDLRSLDLLLRGNQVQELEATCGLGG